MPKYLETIDILATAAVRNGYTIGQEPALGRITVRYLKPSARKPVTFVFNGEHANVFRDGEIVKDYIDDVVAAIVA